MAGKRPDQYRIDPADSGATDHKNLPQTGKGKSNLNDTVNRDRQRLAQSRSEAEEGQPFLPDIPAPSAEANRAARSDQVDREEESDLDQERGS